MLPGPWSRLLAADKKGAERSAPAATTVTDYFFVTGAAAAGLAAGSLKLAPDWFAM